MRTQSGMGPALGLQSRSRGAGLADTTSVIAAACPTYAGYPGFPMAVADIEAEARACECRSGESLRTRMATLAKEKMPRYFGELRTRDDYEFAVRQVAMACPRLKSHSSFEEAACRVVCEAMQSFDPERGSFIGRLRFLARGRVSRYLRQDTDVFARHEKVVSLHGMTGAEATSSQVDPPDLRGADPAALEALLQMERLVAVVGPERSGGAVDEMPEFLKDLVGVERAVAQGLIDGLRQNEIAALHDIHPRKTSRIVAEIRRRAVIHLGLTNDDESLAA